LACRAAQQLARARNARRSEWRRDRIARKPQTGLALTAVGWAGLRKLGRRRIGVDEQLWLLVFYTCRRCSKGRPPPISPPSTSTDRQCHLQKPPTGPTSHRAAHAARTEPTEPLMHACMLARLFHRGCQKSALLHGMNKHSHNADKSYKNERSISSRRPRRTHTASDDGPNIQNAI
jgi:hypothetical protein